MKNIFSKIIDFIIEILKPDNDEIKDEELEEYILMEDEEEEENNLDD